MLRTYIAPLTSLSFFAAALLLQISLDRPALAANNPSLPVSSTTAISAIHGMSSAPSSLAMTSYSNFSNSPIKSGFAILEQAAYQGSSAAVVHTFQRSGTTVTAVSGGIVVPAGGGTTVGQPSGAFAAGDLDLKNGDDLVLGIKPAAGVLTGTVAILQNNGAGNFFAGLEATTIQYAQYPGAGPYPTSVTITDVDGDGRKDLVIGDSAGNIFKCLNTTPWGTTNLSFNCGSAAEWSFPGSIDTGQGTVCTNSYGGYGQVCTGPQINNPINTPTLSNIGVQGLSVVSYADGSYAYIGAFNDSNNVGHVFGHNVETSQGKVDFSSETYFQDPVSSFAVADLNGDGYLDLAVAHGSNNNQYGTSYVEVYYGSNSASVGTPAFLVVATNDTDIEDVNTFQVGDFLSSGTSQLVMVATSEGDNKARLFAFERAQFIQSGSINPPHCPAIGTTSAVTANDSPRTVTAGQFLDNYGDLVIGLDTHTPREAVTINNTSLRSGLLGSANCN